MEETELAVVGAGPAGLAAAGEAAGAGVHTVVIDENRLPGGQLFKQIHKFFGSAEHRAGQRGFDIGTDLLTEVRAAGVDIRLDTTAYGILPVDPAGCAGPVGCELELLREGRTGALRARKVVLATGANEKALAFPGWTLPGVLTAGAAQTLVNIHRVLPGRRVLMVGSGNVGLIVSYQLLQAGAQVVAVLEAQPRINGYGVHAAKVRRAGVAILTGHTVIRAEGEERVERAVVARVDENWCPVPGSEQMFPVDVICLAVGLAPVTELARLAGCECRYQPALGGWVPVHDENLQTAVPGLYIAGDLTGVEEASVALEEGRLAGLAVAEALGRLPQAEAEGRRQEIRSRLKMLRGGSFPRLSTAGKPVTGAPSPEELAGCPGVPPAEALARGPVAVIECLQEIPRNPCEAVCPTGAIRIGEYITDLPHLLPERCRGCGNCVPACPGQA
ncbi:MAG TPA: FAD-dependent oxidoreductase, partial [Firmicutes bacterium]|nr:FAD-dependent oxidoreductase [Bacillota bacterium]